MVSASTRLIQKENPGLYGDELLDVSRKDAFTVRVILGLEQAPTRHTDNACLHPEILQLFPSLHTEADFGAGADEDHIRRIAFDVREHIGAACHTGAFRLAAIKMWDDLPRQYEQSRTVVLNCKSPRLHGFVGISGADDRKPWNRAQAREVLDWLVSRAILPACGAV